MTFIASIKRFTILTILLGLIGACADTADYVNENPHQVGGALFGGAVGVTAGTAIGGAAAEGGLAGAGIIAGLALAPYLSRRDVVFFDKAIDKAAVAPPGQPVAWNNPNTGTTGKITRLNDVDIEAGLTCRGLRSEMTAGSETTVEDLIVCRDESTPWYIESGYLVERRPAN